MTYEEEAEGAGFRTGGEAQNRNNDLEVGRLRSGEIDPIILGVGHDDIVDIDSVTYKEETIEELSHRSPYQAATFERLESGHRPQYKSSWIGEDYSQVVSSCYIALSELLSERVHRPSYCASPVSYSNSDTTNYNTCYG